MKAGAKMNYIIDYCENKLINLRIKYLISNPSLKKFFISCEMLTFACLGNKEIYTLIKSISELFEKGGKK